MSKRNLAAKVKFVALMKDHARDFVIVSASDCGYSVRGLECSSKEGGSVPGLCGTRGKVL